MPLSFIYVIGFKAIFLGGRGLLCGWYFELQCSYINNVNCSRELQHINVPVMLMPDDFRAFSKIKIDNHAFNKENLPSHFKVRIVLKRYPGIFSGERVLSTGVQKPPGKVCLMYDITRNLPFPRFGLDDLDFLNSLGKSPKPIDPIKVTLCNCCRQTVGADSH
jgi:hypothetical protein